MTDTTEELTAAQVSSGAYWLDVTLPGWENKINLDTFSMAGNCILDQLFSSPGASNGYNRMFDIMHASWVTSHGFVFSGRDEWITEIEKRRSWPVRD